MRYWLYILAMLPLIAFSEQPFSYKTTTVTVNSHQLTAEISDTPALQQKGLQGHTPLTDIQAMLFPYKSEAIRTFWMKDMAFPIDIIWLNSNHLVVDISPNASACKQDPCPLYLPTEPIQYVLEVQAGLAKKYGIKAGTYIDFKDSE